MSKSARTENSTLISKGKEVGVVVAILVVMVAAFVWRLETDDVDNNTVVHHICVMDTVDLVGSITMVTPWRGRSYVMQDGNDISRMRCYRFRVDPSGMYRGLIVGYEETGRYQNRSCHPLHGEHYGKGEEGPVVEGSREEDASKTQTPLEVR